MRLNLTWLALTLALPLGAPQALQAEAPQELGDNFAVDGLPATLSGPFNTLRGGTVWETELKRPEAAQLSVFVHQLDMGPRDALVITNGEDELIYTQGDGQGFWTEPLAGGNLRISLETQGRSRGEGVVISGYRADLTPDPTTSIFQRNDLTAIAEAPGEIYDIRGPVARVYMTGIGYCTGFMISRDLMMTNNHCVSSQSTCDRTLIQFNYEADANGDALEVDEYSCVEVVDTDFTLDYSVLRVSNSPGLVYGAYELSRRDPLPSEQGVIIQHPGGNRKAASFNPNCALGAIASGNGSDTDFRHQCDTLSGSSGAPVMAEDGKVLGLHHFGGAGWLPRSANQAVRVGLILDDCDSCRSLD